MPSQLNCFHPHYLNQYNITTCNIIFCHINLTQMQIHTKIKQHFYFVLIYIVISKNIYICHYSQVANVI